MQANGFFSEDVQRVAQVTRAFADPAHSPSSGEVKNAAIFENNGLMPHRDGVACEKIFGPLRRLRCRCGAISGEANDGRVCERCGVLCGDPAERARRSGHITLASGCLHPHLVPLVAELLATSPESVLAVARCEAWWHEGEIYGPPDSEAKLAPGEALWEWEPTAVQDLEPGLRELYRVNAQLRRLGALPEWAKEHFSTEAGWYEQALAGCGASGLAAALDAVPRERAAAFEARHGIAPRELLNRIVPVPPPATRPFLQRPGGLEHPGPTNLAFAQLVHLSGALARLRELEAGVLALRDCERYLQLAFERLVHHACGRLPAWLSPVQLAALPEIDGAPALSAHLPYEQVFPDPDRSKLRRTVSLALAGEVAFVSLPTVTIPLRLRDGHLGKPAMTTGLKLLQVDSDASLAVFLDPAHDSLHVLELDPRQWSTTRPDFLRFTLLRESENETRIVESSSGRATRRQLGSELVVSACGRFYMERVSAPDSTHFSDGWVVRTLDGTAVFEPGEDASGDPLSWLGENAKLRVLADESEVYELESELDSTAAAFVLAESGSFLTLLGSVLVRGHEPVIGFAFPVDAASFDPAGRQLLIASKTKLTLLDVREVPHVVSQWNLGPLFDQMASPRYGGSITALAAALCAYGSLAEVGKHDFAEIGALKAMDESWDMVPMEAREAKRILRMARRVRAATGLVKIR